MSQQSKINFTCIKIIFLVLLNPLFGWAQTESKISFQNSTFFSSDNEIPFWFAANNYGKIIGSGAFLNIVDFNFSQTKYAKRNKNFKYLYGADIVGGIGNESYFQANQIFAGINFKGWELKAGQFHDITKYSGLSSSNGNLVRSQNARPYPLIRFSTDGYKPIPFIKRGLNFKGEFDEGILNDNRFVKNPHIHHKSFYLQYKSTGKWQLSLGIEHFVMWGGTSPIESYGQFPKDFKSYFRYITGAGGDENFPKQDQINIAGNHLGTYQIEFKKQTEKAEINIYLSHIFDATESVKLKNWPDNLIGINLKFNDKNKIITDLVYEFTHTSHQGINDSIFFWDESKKEWERIYNDSYFTHFLYKSGYTYHNRVLGSPLFFPVNTKTDVSGYDYASIESTRFVAHHVGIKGNFGDNIRWKSLVTYIKHLGSYVSPYHKPQKQISGFFEVWYINQKLPFDLGCATAVDISNADHNNPGIKFSLRKIW